MAVLNHFVCYIKQIISFVSGMGHEHFWTSGTDQAEEGKYVAANKINKIKINEFSF